MVGKREAKCGVVTRRKGEDVHLHVESDANGAKVTWDGVQLCGHVWSCPVCATRIRAQRRDEVVQSLLAQRGTWRMLTLTVRHNVAHDAKPLVDGVYNAIKAWRKNGTVARWWRENVKASVRVVEITWGTRTGWHPHVHLMVCGPSEITKTEAKKLSDAWRSAVVAELGDEHEPWQQPAGEAYDPTLDVGCKWGEKPLDTSDEHDVANRAARYVAKCGVEIVQEKKTGRELGRMTVWELAANATMRPDLWLEYCAATKGHRMLEENRGAKEARRKYAEEFLGVPEDVPAPKSVTRIAVSADELAAIRQLEVQFPRTLPDLHRCLIGSSDPKEAYSRWILEAFAKLARLGTLYPHAEPESRAPG